MSTIFQQLSKDSGAGSIDDDSYQHQKCIEALGNSTSTRHSIEIECEVFNKVDPVTLHTITCHVVERDIVRKKKTYKSVHPGTCIVIRLRASHPCHVYIFNKGSSGRISLLVPNEDNATNFIPADRTFDFPPKDADYDFEMDENCGVETLEIFAYTQRLSFDGGSIPDALQECFRDVKLKKKNASTDSPPQNMNGYLELQFNVTQPSCVT